jgi:hypothetical protein
MGNDSSKAKSSNSPAKFFTIKDNYQTLEEVQDALRKSGLESSNRIVYLNY